MRTDVQGEIENILAEIKGLMVDIHGAPNRCFDSEQEVDVFVYDEIAEILKDNLFKETKNES